MPNPKKGSPGCPCCSPANCNACITVWGCCKRLANATVQVFACNAPSTILASGTTNSNGIVCLNLSNANTNSTTLCATVSYPDDYLSRTNSLLGFYCGRGYDFTLTEGEAGGGGGAGINGKLTVTFKTNSGAAISNAVNGGLQASVVYASNSVVAQNAATNATGVAVFSGLPTTTNYLVRSPSIPPGTRQNFPTFTLSCEGVATAQEGDEFGDGQIWEFNSISCTPVGRVCCGTCFPNTLPLAFTVSDPSAIWQASSTNSACGPPTNGTATINWAPCLSPLQPFCNAPATEICGYAPPSWTGSTGTPTYTPAVNATSYSGSSSYTLWCDSANSTFKLTVASAVECWCTCCQIGLVNGVFVPCADCRQVLKPKTNGASWQTVTATSWTCDPFTATFDLPSQSVTLQPCFGPSCVNSVCPSVTYPARTITITE